MTEARMAGRDITRIAVGVFTLLLGLGAGWRYLVGDPTTGGILARSAAIVGAVWIAYPSLQRLTPRTLVIGALAAAVVFLRPRSAVAVIPILLIFGVRRPR